MRARRARRGWSTWAAFSAVMSISVLAWIALSARTADLAFEDRSLCRVRAKWGAESAIARGRAEGTPLSLSGTLDDAVSYQLRGKREGGERVLEGEGTCRMKERTVRVKIEARLAADGRVIAWRETSPGR